MANTKKTYASSRSLEESGPRSIRRLLWFILVMIIVAVIVAVAVGGQVRHGSRPEPGLTDPADESKCVTPNDAIVDCEMLRQNPRKTDWL